MIDHHVHLGVDKNDYFSLSSDELSRKMDKYRIEKSLVFACPDVEKRLNPYESANYEILKASEKDARFVPIMFVHPFSDTLDYVQESSKDFKGFKLHQRGENQEYDYGGLKTSKVLDYLLETEKPIIFHTGYRPQSRIKRLKPIIEKSRGPIVLAHSGDLIHEDLVDASKYSNVYIDVSPLATMLHNNFFVGEAQRDTSLQKLTSENILDYLTSLFGENIVWGSDTPWCDKLTPNGYEKEVETGRLMEEKGLIHTFIK